MQGDCTGTALVFSGRPDPEWIVSAEARSRLQEIWSRLQPAASAPPAAPPLGYRGCTLRCPSDEEWFAYGGVVSYTAAARRLERRNDPERVFERLLVSTAPDGALPPNLI